MVGQSNGMHRDEGRVRWISITGDFAFRESGEAITFNGKPAPFMDATGQEQIGLSVGVAMSSSTFSGGEISAGVTFSKVVNQNACEIIFYRDAERGAHVSAGIGPGRYAGSAFVIRQFGGTSNGGWTVHAEAGARESLKPDQRYEISVTVRGSRVALKVDGVEVLSQVLPFSLPPSQVGLFCLDDSRIEISDYQVSNRRGDVFVVMQFSSPFTEIHEEIIKKVCGEFELNALRGDESYGPGVVLTDIAHSIDESEFIIAEITPSNPNVYYELGYAHAVNKPVILLADRTLEKLPFDVSSFRVLFYDNSMIGRSKFEDGLRRHISAILTKNSVAPAMMGAAAAR